MNYTQELNKATEGMSQGTAKKLAEELRESIKLREQQGICGCGVRGCHNPVHIAIDNLAIISVERVLLGEGNKAE